MALLQEIWRLEPDGVLAAEIGNVRLVIRKPAEAGALVRFLVLRRGAEEDSLIGSGTEADVRSAMQTASRMAERLRKARNTWAGTHTNRGGASTDKKR
jgi:hypothetical protein